MPRPLLPLLLLLAGCATWRPATLPSTADTAWSATGDLRLRTTEGGELRGTTVSLARDSMRIAGGPAGAGVVIPRDHAAGLQRRTFDGGKTAGLLLVLTGIVAVTGVIVGNSLSGIGGGLGY